MAGKGRTKKSNAKNWDDLANAGLTEAKEACCYLAQAFAEGPEVFLLALNRIINARGGVSLVAKRAGLSRESLYKLLSGERGARLSSVAKILSALEIRVEFFIDNNEQTPRKKSDRKKIVGSRAA